MIRGTLSSSLLIIALLTTALPFADVAAEVANSQTDVTPKKDRKTRINHYTSFLALDLDGDGVEMGNIQTDSVYWDGNIDTFAEECAWIKPDDGLLAIDLDDDNQIKSNRELFGNVYEDGFTILALHDSNKDGIIDKRDTVWPRLRVWHDRDANAHTDYSELKTLDQFRIISIDLGHEKSNIVSPEARLTRLSRYLYDRAPGQGHRAIANVRIPCSGSNSFYEGAYLYDPSHSDLPTLRGYGVLPGLNVSMYNDKDGPDSLAALVRQLSETSFEEAFAPGTIYDDAFSNVLYRWARVENVPSDSRGRFIDARQLAYTEKLTANNFRQHGAGGTPNPLYWGAYSVKQAFHLLFVHQRAQFMLQGAARELFLIPPTYDARLDVMEGSPVLDEARLSDLQTLSHNLNPAEKDQYWLRVLQIIEYGVGIEKLDAESKIRLRAAISYSGALMLYEDMIERLDFVHPRHIGSQSFEALVSQKVINTGKPDKIFKMARKNSREQQLVLSDVITDIIKQHGSSEEDVTKFLRSQGYGVFNITASINQEKEFDVPDLYTLILQAHKPASLKDRFKRSLRWPYDSYDIISYFKEDSLEWAFAHVKAHKDRTRPDNEDRHE